MPAPFQSVLYSAVANNPEAVLQGFNAQALLISGYKTILQTWAESMDLSITWTVTA